MVNLDTFKLHLANMTLDLGKDVWVEAERDAILLRAKNGYTVIIAPNDIGQPIAFLPSEEGKAPVTSEVSDLPRFMARLAGCLEWWNKIVAPKLIKA